MDPSSQPTRTGGLKAVHVVIALAVLLVFGGGLVRLLYRVAHLALDLAILGAIGFVVYSVYRKFRSGS